MAMLNALIPETLLPDWLTNSPMAVEAKKAKAADRAEQHRQLAAERLEIQAAAKAELDRLAPLERKARTAFKRTAKAHDESIAQLRKLEDAIMNARRTREVRESRIDGRLNASSDPKIPTALTHMNTRFRQMQKDGYRAKLLPPGDGFSISRRSRSNQHGIEAVCRAVATARYEFAQLQLVHVDDVDDVDAAIEKIESTVFLSRVRGANDVRSASRRERLICVTCHSTFIRSAY